MIKENAAGGIERMITIAKNNFGRCKQISGWWPAYIDSPESRIPELSSAFTALREVVAVSNPSFLDCGCGDGTTLGVALQSGFSQTFGIEINPQLFNIAQNNLLLMGKEGIVQKDAANIAFGSYYLPDFVNQLIPRCLRHQHSRFQDEPETDADNFGDYLKAWLDLPLDTAISLEETVKSFLLPDPNLHPYNQLGLLDEKGKIKADVVYIFPSDPFLEPAFFYQMDQAMKDGSILAVLSPADDLVQPDISCLKEKGALALSGESDVPMLIQFYAKETPTAHSRPITEKEVAVAV